MYEVNQKNADKNIISSESPFVCYVILFHLIVNYIDIFDINLNVYNLKQNISKNKYHLNMG